MALHCVFVLIAGLLLQIAQLAWIGVVLFALATVFALITLPVEFDASRRAKEALANLGLTDGGLQRGEEALGRGDGAECRGLDVRGRICRVGAFTSLLRQSGQRDEPRVAPRFHGFIASRTLYQSERRLRHGARKRGLLGFHVPRDDSIRN